MKRIAICVMMVIVFLTACSVQKGEKQVNEATEAPEVSALVKATESPETVESVEPAKTPEPEENLKTKEFSKAEDMVESAEYSLIGKEIKPLLSERVDSSKQGVNMSLESEYSFEVTKGEDGSCYYFRSRKEKIVFYKDNGIKVCETDWNRAIKKHFSVVSFVKSGNYFFLALRSFKNVHTILTTINITTGEWGDKIETSDKYENIVVYKGKFYCINGSQVTIYNFSGKQKNVIDICPERYAGSAIFQGIVDDKIYFIMSYTYGPGKYKKSDIKIMRCNLDGRKKEVLFQHERGGSVNSFQMGSMVINGEYIYLFGKNGDKYGLVGIPLYGGKIKEIADSVNQWFEVSNDSIFFLGYCDKNNDEYIYKVDKNFEGKPEKVTRAHYYQIGLHGMEAYPFRCTDGHLIVQAHNKKQRVMVNKALDYAFCMDDWDLCADITINFAPDYYWVTEDGRIESIIKGSDIKKRWKKIAEEW